jgi:hypothetical protein
MVQKANRMTATKHDKAAPCFNRSVNEISKDRPKLTRAVLLASAPVAALAAIVLTRPYDGALFHYARTGSDWSHHYIRVLMARELPKLQLGGFLDWLLQGDHDFPPLIHVLGAPGGFVVGHGEAEIARMGLIWVLPLALAVGSVAYSLSASKRLGIAGFVMTALLPPFHAASLNYYFDLPMTALVWCSIAILIAGQDRHPILAGSVAGLFLFLSGLAKWSSLPMAPPVLLGIMLCRRPSELGVLQRWKQRLLCALALSVSTGALLASYWQLSTRSWNRMMHMTYGTNLDPGSEFLRSSTAMDAVMSIVNGLPTLFDPGRHFSTEPFAFYSIRGVFCFLSPPIAVFLALLFGLWCWKSRTAWPLFATTVAGYLVLFTLVIPTLDERFLLTPVPVFLLLVLLAWRTLPRTAAGLIGAAYIATALWVAWDFHHTPVRYDPGPDGGPQDAGSSEFLRIWQEVELERHGIGLQSASDSQWGWMRNDQPQPVYLRLRERLWEQLVRCEVDAVLVQEQLTATGIGEGLWWAYRNELARLRGEYAFDSIQGFTESVNDVFTGASLEVAELVSEDLVVALSSYDLRQPNIPRGSPGVIGDDWTLRAVADRGKTEGTSHLAIWTPEGSQRCPQWQDQIGAIDTVGLPGRARPGAP